MKLAPQLLNKAWFRNLVLLPVKLSGKRQSNKTENYGDFRHSNSRIEKLEQVSLFVTDIEASRTWFKEVAGLNHERTCAPEPHPTQTGHTLTCCYMSASDHTECLVLIEHRDAKGEIQAPSNKGVFHTAFEVEGNGREDVYDFHKQSQLLDIEHFYGPVRHNDSPIDGDGESGGNVAVYYFTPDWHNIEFYGDMDTVENYEERYGGRDG